MALIWADFPNGSQGLYGDDETAMLDGIWAAVEGQLVNDPDPVVGSAGRVLSLGLSTNSHADIVLPTSQATVGLARRIWMDALPTNAAGPHIFEWRTAGNSLIGYIIVTPTGSIAYDSGGGSFEFETAGPVVTANAWFHIEAKLTCSTEGAAEIEVRVNGATKLTGGTFSTSNATVGRISMARGDFGSTIGGSSYCKDFIIWDDTGDVDNDFFGSVTVFFRKVVSTISIGGWTLSSGSDAAALIGHTGPPVDTDFVAADDTPPAACEFDLEDLPDDITSVRGVIPIVRGGKIDGGDGNLQLSLSPNGVDYDVGPDTPLTSAMTYWPNATAPFVSMLNPATNAPYTPAEFNASRLKIDRTL